MTCRKIVLPDEALKINLGAPCPPELFADLVFTAVALGEPPWLDAPTHDGFWWMRRHGREPTIVRVKFFTVGATRYTNINDTFGDFACEHETARWQAIDTPCGEVAP